MQEPFIPGQDFALQTPDDGRTSGVSWGAVFAGAAAAASLSFILLLLGVGLGLSSMSPYSYNALPITGATIAWLAFMQFAASGVGGYLAGRLRVRWSNVHGDEVHFRDTAHGLLAWAVATLVTAALLAGSIKAVLGGVTEVGTAATAIVPVLANAGSKSMDTDYYSNMLVRSASSDGAANGQRSEINNIIVSSLADGKLTAEDRAYLAQAVARHSGLSPADAERRVDEIYARATHAASNAKAKALRMADEARKTAAYSALWMFVVLLFGAFIASLAATFGGRRRDDDRILLRSPI